ncbi:HD-GYP domain-containing protein [Vogesella fluminis]|uniref:Transcriptional regulator n=1 Tax=Vogesella fluminis TaxID=1069161 RepID=A0ABQ3H7R3_9NEIS|nr:HD-GYP domain-containing protein [Vogesella fluminis]GHD71579.1 transcriptional regulator [Vogesella fluminis]
MTGPTIEQKIAELHQRIKSHVGDVGRIGVAIYNKDDDGISTFVHSTDGAVPFENYHARLQDVPSLRQLHEKRQSRVIDDLTALSGSPNEHSRRILESGYKSSYTSPLYAHDQLIGFVFFDSHQPNHFRQEIRLQVDAYSQLIAALISEALSPSRILRGAVMFMRELGRHKDTETADHMQRVASYARSVARTLAASHGISDEQIEFIYQFASLHDIGKIVVPDHILLKPGRLTADEYLVAQSHARKGSEMIRVMVSEFGFANEPHIQTLYDIVCSHHERWDGAGYPDRLAGQVIPLSARIVAVADVFDALTNPRPYKQAWTLHAGLDYLRANAGSQFDPQCVLAAEACFDDWCATHARFSTVDPDD